MPWSGTESYGERKQRKGKWYGKRFAIPVEYNFELHVFRSTCQSTSATPSTEPHSKPRNHVNGGELSLGGFWEAREVGDSLRMELGFWDNELTRSEALRRGGRQGRFASGLSTLPLPPVRATVWRDHSLSFDSASTPTRELHTAFANVIEELCLTHATAVESLDCEIDWYGFDPSAAMRGVDSRTAKLLGIDGPKQLRSTIQARTATTRENLRDIATALMIEMQERLAVWDIVSLHSFIHQVSKIEYRASMKAFKECTSLDKTLSILGQLALATWHQRAWSRLREDREAMLDFEPLLSLMHLEFSHLDDYEVDHFERQAVECIGLANDTINSLATTIMDLKNQAAEFGFRNTSLDNQDMDYLQQTLLNLLTKVQTLQNQDSINAMNAAFVEARLTEARQRKASQAVKKQSNSRLSNTGTPKQSKTPTPSSLWGLFGQFAGLTIDDEHNWAAWQATQANLQTEDWKKVVFKHEQFSSERERTRTKRQRQRRRDRARQLAARSGLTLEELRTRQQQDLAVTALTSTTAQDLLKASRLAQEEAAQLQMRQNWRHFRELDANSNSAVEDIKAKKREIIPTYDELCRDLMSKSVWEPEMEETGGHFVQIEAGVRPGLKVALDMMQY